MNDTQHPCLNCGSELVGQYCGRCGQRATSRLISLWELVRDAFGDLFELDSRLWRTLLPLLARPGHLTRDYLEGRRARYMPPFRMYLVLSLIFFLVAFFDPQRDFEIFFEPDEATLSDSTTGTPGTDAVEGLNEEQRREVREALDKLVRDGVIDESRLGPDGLMGLAGEGAPEAAPEAPETPAVDAPVAGTPPRNEPGDFELRFGEDNVIDCEAQQFDMSSFPGWIQRRATPERLDRLCHRWQAAGSEGIKAAIIDRIPAALILLLPLMALVLKLLYPLSRRYYVEHLLFCVHFHSFFFLLLTLQLLWARLIAWLGLHEAFAVLPIVASSFYIPVYLFVALRRVYGQGRFFTFVKFLVLTITYLVSFSIMLLGALLLAAVSV